MLLRKFVLTGMTAALVLLSGVSVAQLQDEEVVDDLAVWNLDEYEAATGETLNAFQEAPMLAEMVAAGELPPLEERLPEREDIAVVQPRTEVGVYGGELTWYGLNPVSFGNAGWSAWDQFFRGVSTNFDEFYPAVARSVELSDDLKTVTITLRRGMKWSDGEPFTTSDVEFWFNDIALNPDLPALNNTFRPGGDNPVLEIMDDVTFSLTFAQPYPVAMVLFGVDGAFFAPRHYLEQFHPDYNENAAQLATDAGYDNWYTYFDAMSTGQTGDTQTNPDLPVLKPWVLDSVDQFGNKFYSRNPYYYKVDVEGNQLPYVDTQVRLLLSESEVVKLRIEAGDIDYAVPSGGEIGLSDLPTLKAGEESGDYTTLLLPAGQGTMNAYGFNITTNDPVLREIFNDIRFRQAMSLAINRAEVNETLFFGLGVERQWGPPSSSPFYEDWMGPYYADYDPEQANELLDEMGLEMGPDGVRLRPDGQPLKVVLWDAINEIPQSELVAEYWEAVGVDVEINPSTREAYQQAALANDTQAVAWFGGNVTELTTYRNPIWYRPPYGLDSTPIRGGMAWRQWWLSNGEEGEEPEDPYYIQQMELADQFQQTVQGSDEYYELGTLLTANTVERMLQIGIVGEAPRIGMRSNDLVNFPDNMFFEDYLRGGHSDQWFLRSSGS